MIILLGSAFSLALTGFFSVTHFQYASAQTAPQEPDPAMMLSVEFQYYFNENGCNQFGCGQSTVTEHILGSAPLYVVNGGFAGNGTGNYSYVSDDELFGSSLCPPGEKHHSSYDGTAAIAVQAQYSINNNVTGGPDTSMYDENTTVVEVSFSDQNVRWESMDQDCDGNTNSDSGQDESLGFGCFFYNVDLDAGGTYNTTIGVTSESDGTCTMTITPYTCEFDSPDTQTASYQSTESMSYLASTVFSSNPKYLRVLDGIRNGHYQSIASAQDSSNKCLKIKITVDPAEIHLKYNVDQTDVIEKPTAKVTIKVTKGTAPVKNKSVMIKVCTLPGTPTTDGHIWHDSRVQGWEKNWYEECNQGKRPFAELKAKDGKKGHLLVQKTDGDGKIELTYTPPKYLRYQYIAGTDKITATIVAGARSDPPKYQDSSTMVTKVPDLQAMPGSGPARACPSSGNLNYTFATQAGSKHGCLFYGTSSTNSALREIANTFMQRQKQCIDDPRSTACTVSYPGLSSVKITGRPVMIKINAMSLPWGGLTDNVVVMWSPPHKTHNDGRQVDLSLAIFNTQGTARNSVFCSGFGSHCQNYDINRILLLRDVIVNSGNLYKFPSNEGGNLRSTFNDISPHFHIYFKN